MYQEKRTKLIDSFDPLIVTYGGQVTLIHRGQNTTFSSTPRFYHNVKTISHVPLAIFVFLFEPSSNDRNLTSNEINFLKIYLSRIRQMKRSMNISDFSSSEETFQRQHQILDCSIKYLRSILRSKYLNFDSLRQYCSETERLFSKNFLLAVRSQLDQLHSQVYPWYQNHLNTTERSKLQILIIGPKTAREGFLMTQYMEKLLADQSSSHQGKRILFVENFPEISIALNVLSTWVLDQHAAEAFFHDKTRLHSDLLKNDANDYIKELFS